MGEPVLVCTYYTHTGQKSKPSLCAATQLSAIACGQAVMYNDSMEIDGLIVYDSYRGTACSLCI